MTKTFRLKSLPKRIKLKPTEKKLTLRVKGDPISKGKSEAQIQAEIRCYLDSCKVLNWALDIKGKPILTRKGYRLMPNENRGFADIHCCFKGLAIYLEVKKCGGLASEHQIEMQTRVRQAGGIYEFVTSIREVQMIFSRLYK
jgi:hypothetical protein